jgi:hypothetical protein
LGIGGRAGTPSGSPYIVLNASSKRDLQEKVSIKDEAPSNQDGTEYKQTTTKPFSPKQV